MGSSNYIRLGPSAPLARVVEYSRESFGRMAQAYTIPRTMTDPLRISCPCGYENWVPEEKRGQTIPCFICGHELLVEEPAAESTLSPEASCQPGNSVSAAPIAKVEERPAKSTKPRSPFEDDEVETAVRPKFQYTPPPPVAPPPAAPRARSPFEADTQEADRILRRDDKFVAGPFSLEMAPAPKEGPSTIDQMEALRPKGSSRRHVFIDTISPHDAPTGEKCAQCGKELRGSWDRIETHIGVLCYVCSNQATHDVPARLKADTSARREVRESELITGPVAHAMPVEDRAWFLDTKSDGFRRTLILLAFGTLLFALYVFMFGSADQAVGPTEVDVAAAPNIVDIPAWARWVVNGVTILSLVVVVFLSIYIALAIDDSLPHETFFRNVVIVGAVSGPLGLMHFLGIWSASLIAPLAYAGTVYPPLILLTRWIISILTLTHWFRFRFFSIVVYFVLFNLLYQLVSFAFGSLIAVLFPA